MLIDAIRKALKDFDFLDGISLLFFFSTMPVILPCIDALNSMMAEGGGQGLGLVEATPFLWTMLIALMATCLALLFICLLKTSYTHLEKGPVLVGTIAYVCGYAVVVFAGWFPGCPEIVLQVAGVPLGFGLGIMCIVWLEGLRLYSLRASFFVMVVTLLAASIINIAVLFVPTNIGITVLGVLACVGTLGALRRHGRVSGQYSHQSSDSNWWDIFGRLDVSLVEGAKDFKSPTSRFLLFVATPLVMLLLFVINRTTAVFSYDSPTSIMVACLIVAVCSIPLLFVKNDQTLMNMSYRLLLPLLAFGVFAVDSFVNQEFDGTIMSVGVNMFCVFYFMLMASMVITMAGRMRSLVFPAGSILLISLALVAVLSFTKVNAGALIAYQHHVLVVLFVLTVASLLAMPNTRMLHAILEGASLSGEDISLATSVQQRCEGLAEEYSLTSREKEILVYLGRGYSAAYVSELLVVAESTVRSHRKNIYRKLGINSREELLDMIDSQESLSEEDSDS